MTTVAAGCVESTTEGPVVVLTAPDGSHQETNEDIELAEEPSITATDDGNHHVLLEHDDKRRHHDWRSVLCACTRRKQSTDGLADYQRLISDKRARSKSMLALRFAVFTTSLAATILTPNYPIMVSPKADPDSFSTTAPFDFNSATYFLPMTALLGIATSSIFVGTLSDKVGRRPLVLLTTIGGTIGTMLKWFFRWNFWAFSGVNFLNGLLSSNLPVALAYVGDLFSTRKQKEEELSIIIAIFVLALSGGGIVVILMESAGLFSALWVGAGMQLLSAIFAWFWLIEPGDVRLLSFHSDPLNDQLLEDEDEEEGEVPTKLDKGGVINITIGALMDNIGSAGIYPLALSPLAFNKYYADFADRGEEPIMNLTGYKWIAVMLAAMVVPSTFVSPMLFQKMGAAVACVIGNVLTAILIIALLLIASGPATGGMFGAFVAVLYMGYPFTVVSQLTTGPMLDILAPSDKRGFVHGINITAMNFSSALAPWVLGFMADEVGTTATMWTTVGISFAAALVNVPLIFRTGFGPAPEKRPPERRPLLGEDKELVEQALRGEWVPPEWMAEINDERERKGLPYLVMHAGTYDADKDRLGLLQRRAQEVFEFEQQRVNKYLHEIATNHDKAPALCSRVNRSLKADPKEIDAIHCELGQWFAEHLKENGYHAHLAPVMTKQMILSAFPPMTRDKEYTPENVEQALLNMQQIFSQYIDLHEDERYTLKEALVTEPGLIRYK